MSLVVIQGDKNILTGPLTKLAGSASNDKAPALYLSGTSTE